MDEQRITVNSGTRGIRMVDGMPVPTFYPLMNNSTISAVNRAVLSTEYIPKTDKEGNLLPGEEQYKGCTKLEVAAMRRADKAANGDDDAYERTLDRTIGKPKQINENINVNVSLQQGLDQIADNLGITDVDVIEPPKQIEKRNKLSDLW